MFIVIQLTWIKVLKIGCPRCLVLNGDFSCNKMGSGCGSYFLTPWTGHVQTSTQPRSRYVKNSDRAHNIVLLI